MNESGRGSLPTQKHGMFNQIKSYAAVGLPSALWTLAIPFAWTVRAVSNPRKAYQDVTAVLVVLLLFNWSYATESTKNGTFLVISRFPTLSVTGVAVVAGGVLLYSSVKKKERLVERTKENGGLEFLQPLMIPCQTTHTRLFPTTHSFSYSYLYAGIPIGWSGPAGNILSADNQLPANLNIKKRSTWFDIAGEDYLGRGLHPHGLSGKLREYLDAQGLGSDKFSYAYLVTAPRFLGFSFNPVSFWYLYDQDRSLKAMILEVNNTFDERRMYYMDRGSHSDQSQGGINFSYEWAKDFHVSPFNDRGGSYSLQAVDPFHSTVNGLRKIHNNIVLKSSEGKPKIVARVFSTKPALDATKMTSWATFYFVLQWWWVGFMTNPRILREARILWVKKLQLYYRPEVFHSSIGRSETREEAALEPVFSFLLRKLSAEIQTPFSYTAAAGPSRGKPLLLSASNKQGNLDGTEAVQIRVLTPAFYGELVRCGSLVEVFNRLCFYAKEGGAMVEISHPETFKLALTQYCASLTEIPQQRFKWRNMVGPGYLSAISILPRTVLMAPNWILRRSTTKWQGASELDLLVAQTMSITSRLAYQQNVLTVLLADRVAFGWTFILRVYGTCIWMLLVFLAASRCQQSFPVAKSYATNNANFFLNLN